MDDILISIFLRCSAYDRMMLSRTCKQFSLLLPNAYHKYYLYSLEWLTPETPIDKRFLNLIARKTYKAGKLDLETVEILESRGHSMVETRTRMGYDIEYIQQDIPCSHPNK